MRFAVWEPIELPDEDPEFCENCAAALFEGEDGLIYCPNCE